MRNYLRFREWPLRLKMSIFFIGVAAIPLLAVTLIEFANQRQQIIEHANSLLTARADEVSSALDEFNQGYFRSARQLSSLPEVRRYIQASNADRKKMSPAVSAILGAWHRPDSNLLEVGILDSSGTLIVGTEKASLESRLAFHGYVQEALRGSPVISDLHFAIPALGSAPTVAYMIPFKDTEGKVLGVVALWVRAAAIWRVLEDRNEKAGEKSFSVMFDRFGVRIGHSYNKDIVFHPGGKLEPSVVDAMVAERRFGERTREFLEAPREFPEQFQRATAASPDTNVFLGFAPVNQLWNYGVAHRLRTVSWTLFYMIPEASLEPPIRALTKRMELLGIAVILIALAVGIVIAREIIKPIVAVSSAAEVLGKGDTSVRVAVVGRDEISTLAESFNRMADSLQENAVVAERIATGDLSVEVQLQSDKDVLGHAFSTMVKNLREVNSQIKGGASVLAGSASEILATINQVASSATETSSAVSETIATVEEVKQTAQMASQKAKYVSESAQKTAQVSLSGKKAVEDAIAGMQRIQEQMESIAESIVRLSEQSQAIGEIIATVNDISEQSSVLAVNAAIEATKAGEQGKGFGVVAQEVKSLAEQSKQATAQVRAILGDIQKATSAAVLATEQGHKAVEAGVKQSAEASDAIKQLADSINESAQAATQIAASSQQQMVGMDQVALAMENIKLASTQNVVGTKQAEVAAQSLHELGVKLSAMIGGSAA